MTEPNKPSFSARSTSRCSPDRIHKASTSVTCDWLQAGAHGRPLNILASVPFHTYAWRMHGIAKWVALLFIVLVAVSPIFEVFDKTDSWTQDTSDSIRYVLCLFCFLAFSLRRTVITVGLTSIRNWIIRPMRRSRIERKSGGVFLQGTKDRGLFLTFHDLRI